MNKTQAARIHKELLAAAEVIAKPYGLKAVMKGGQYDDSRATLKIEFISADPAQNPDRLRWTADYNEWAKWNGQLEADWLNTNFKIRGKVYRLIGVNGKARKYPFLGEHGGKIYKFDEDQIVLAFGGTPKNRSLAGWKKN